MSLSPGRLRLAAAAGLALALLGGALLASRRQASSELVNDSRFLMGTYIQLTLRGPDKAALDAAMTAAWQEMTRLETAFDPWKGEGPLHRLNDSPAGTPVPLGGDVADLLRLALDFRTRSSGAFSPTLGAMIRLWGFAEMADPHLPPAQAIADTLPHVDPTGLTLSENGTAVRTDPRLLVDLGGIAKGEIVDKVAQLLTRRGVNDFIVNAGGNLLVRGDRGDGPWKIGVADPDDRDALAAKLAVTDLAVVTSGDYERFFEKDGVRYHHIFDPATGYPARGMRSVTIVAPSCGLSDALSTAVFVLGEDRGLALARNSGAEVMIIGNDGKIRQTPGMAKYVTWTSPKRGG